MKAPASTPNRAASASICRTLRRRRPASISETTPWLPISGRSFGVRPCSSIRKRRTFDTGSVGQTVMLLVVRLYQHTQCFDQPIARVFGVIADFVHERVEPRDGSVILPLTPDGEEWLPRVGNFTRSNDSTRHLHVLGNVSDSEHLDLRLSEVELVRTEKDPGSLGCARDDTKIRSTRRRAFRTNFNRTTTAIRSPGGCGSGDGSRAIVRDIF